MKQKQIIERLEKILTEFNDSDDREYGLNYNLVYLIMQLKNQNTEDYKNIRQELYKRKLITKEQI